MATAKKAVARVVPIGPKIDAMWALREKKRALEDQVKVIEDQLRMVEEELIADLDAQHVDKMTGKMATVSISEVQVGNCTDWDAFYTYVKKTGYFHLFQRRLSDPAVREIFEQKGKLPGVELFTKRKLNLRKV
jgi:hypothetical protein